jgi:hypothetical protein
MMDLAVFPSDVHDVGAYNNTVLSKGHRGLNEISLV